MADETTEGLRDALGQLEKIVTIADAKSAADGNRNNTTDVVIRKLKAKQFARIFDQIDELVQKGVVKLTDDTGSLIFGKDGLLTQFREERMILRGGQPVLNMIAIATGLPQSHVDDLDLLDLARLLAGEWEVQERFFSLNQSEFKLALGPLWNLVTGLKQRLRSSQTESSPDSSTSSSAAATEPSAM